MYAFDDSIEAAWRSSHETVISVSLVTSTLDFIRTLNPSDGKVDVDARRSIRRTMSLTLPDYDGSLTPVSAYDYPLGPFSNNLIVITRSLVGGSVNSVVPLGVFAPTSVSVSTDDNGTTVSVEGEDISGRLSKPWNGRTYQVPSGTLLTNAIVNMLQIVDANLSFDLQPSLFTTPGLVFGTDDNSSPWADAQKLAQAAGHALYVANDNYVTSREYLSPQGEYSLLLNAGTDGVVLSLKRSMAQRAAKNGVILTGEGSGLLNPLRAINVPASEPPGWWVTDTNSPLNYLNYGCNADSIATPVILNQTQIDSVAPLLLNSIVGVQIEVEIVPLPHLEVGDRVAVYDADAGVSLTGIVDAFGISLNATSSQSVTVRTMSLGGAD